MSKQKKSLFAEYWQAPIKNKIAVIVLLVFYPFALLGDLFSWFAEKLYDLDSFILRWMEIWTGNRNNTNES